MWRCVHTSTWCGLSLARTVISVIGVMYLGVTCGLTKHRGFWESAGLLRRTKL